jgi:hypothetical protein
MHGLHRPDGSSIAILSTRVSAPALCRFPNWWVNPGPGRWLYESDDGHEAVLVIIRRSHE